MKVHFRIYLIVWIAGSSQIVKDCVGHSNYVSTEKTRVLASQMTEL